MKQKSKKKLWVVTREFADIAEAGGVKNVACSLSIAATKHCDVTVFIPQYGCTKLDKIEGYKTLNLGTEISIGHTTYNVDFAVGFIGKIRVVFIVSPYFLSKLGVYTYTKEEEAINPNHRSGTGHEECQMLDVLFQRSVLEYGFLNNDKADIVHCHDAAASLVPFFANAIHKYKNLNKDTKFYVTIHNAGPGYHHEFYGMESAMKLMELPYNSLVDGLCNGNVEPYLLACKYAKMTTVSPWYAQELLDKNNEFTGGLSVEFAKRSIEIVGITNGIDFFRYDPSDRKKSLLNYEYNPEKLELQGKYKERQTFLEKFSCYNELENLSQFGVIKADKNTKLFSYHGRLVWQKGIEIFEKAVELVLNSVDNACFIVMGQGQRELEEKNMQLSQKYNGSYIYFCGYDRFLARETVAVSDYIVLPSLFEPCCLEDLIAQIYGTIPVAAKSGGLQKIDNGSTGYIYEPNTPEQLGSFILDLCKNPEKENEMKSIIQTGSIIARNEFSWDNIFEKYYKKLFEI